MKLIDKIYNDKAFINNVSYILNHKEFIKTKNIIHHGNTRFNHSIRVAYLSYKLSKFLGFDYKASTRAGLLHDFFLERDDKNILTGAKMLIDHPTIAKNNAIKYFGVNEKEQNIIESHMFPISIVAPKYKEAWLVSLCDKLVSLVEGAINAKAHASTLLLFFINFLK